MRKNTDKKLKLTKPEPVAIVVRVVAQCTECGNKETLYVDEKTEDTVKHTCKKCKNDEFRITYR